MKIHFILLLALVFGSAAFLLGNRTQSSDSHASPTSEPKLRLRPRPDLPSGHDTGRDNEKPPFATVTRNQAERLSPDQRLKWFGQAARLSDINQQAGILCGLIAAMSRDELPDAVRGLLDARTHGGDISHAVWSSLWKRVGQLAPEIILNSDPTASKALSQGDWLQFMDGWLKSDPAAAMAWAQTGKHGEWMAPAVARAITASAGGDLRQMESAILKLSPNTATTLECLQDYYDLALVSGGKAGPAELYETLAPELRESAWPVTLGRLTYTAPREAATWLEDHSKDAGVDYQQTEQLAYQLGKEDPVWTMEWLSRVEMDNRKNGEIQGPPLSWTVENIWRRKDPAAADAWQAAQRAKFEATKETSQSTR